MPTKKSLGQCEPVRQCLVASIKGPTIRKNGGQKKGESSGITRGKNNDEPADVPKRERP